MRNRERGGSDRHLESSNDLADRRHEGHHRHGGGHRGEHGGGHDGGRGFGERGRRPFDYGELRLLTLAMIAEQPRHGYELMKAIEERMGGSYSPSPGVMYPTLSWLEDMGYAFVENVDAGRKRYQVTAEGQAFLAANVAALDELTARIGAGGGRPGVPAPVVRGMENLKLALRLRLRRGALEPAAAEAIAAALDAAAQAVERT